MGSKVVSSSLRITHNFFIVYIVYKLYHICSQLYCYSFLHIATHFFILLLISPFFCFAYTHFLYIHFVSILFKIEYQNNIRFNTLLYTMSHYTYTLMFYTFEQLKPHKVRFKFKWNVADKSIKTHTECANINVHRCKCYKIYDTIYCNFDIIMMHPFCHSFIHFVTHFLGILLDIYSIRIRSTMDAGYKIRI